MAREAGATVAVLGHAGEKVTWEWDFWESLVPALSRGGPAKGREMTSIPRMITIFSCLLENSIVAPLILASMLWKTGECLEQPHEQVVKMTRCLGNKLEGRWRSLAFQRENFRLPDLQGVFSWPYPISCLHMSTKEDCLGWGFVSTLRSSWNIRSKRNSRTNSYHCLFYRWLNREPERIIQVHLERWEQSSN